MGVELSGATSESSLLEGSMWDLSFEDVLLVLLAPTHPPMRCVVGGLLATPPVDLDFEGDVGMVNILFKNWLLSFEVFNADKKQFTTIKEDTFSTTIAATGYLRGLPLGHTAASIQFNTLSGCSPTPSARLLAALSTCSPQI